MNKIATFILRKMSTFSRLNILVVFVLLFGNHAFPQKEMKLEECIQIALDRNIGIKRQGLQVDLAKDNLQTSQATRLPDIQGFYSHNLSSGKTVNYENYTYINTKYQDGNVGIQGTLPIFSGFSNWYLTKSARYSLLSETDKRAELEKALTIEVTAAYLQILFAEELLGVAEAKLESSKEQLRMNEGFFETGRMAKVEVLTMRSQVGQDNLSKIQTENDVRTAYLSLAQLLNLDNENELRIQKPASLDGTISLAINDPDKICEYAQINHPGISSAEFLVKSRESQLAAMRARISPSVSLNGLLYSRYSELGVNQLNPTASYPYSEQLKDNMYSRAAINVNIPIFSQFQTRSRISQASIQARDAKLSLDQKKLSIRHDIQLAYSAALNARAKYEATAEAIASANESFNLTQEKYKAGISSSVEFKVAQNQLIQAQLTRIQSKYEFIIRSKILDLYLDKPITLE
ncbi:MAG: TolC family protein [Porphyromonadaceae bacterium]|nr:MAG: TolC family protein [Porphyromonadaceae bacterium]